MKKKRIDLQKEAERWIHSGFNGGKPLGYEESKVLRETIRKTAKQEPTLPNRG